jgi:hypothetical protein
MTITDAILRNFLEPFSYLVYAVTFLLEYRKKRSTGKKVFFIYYMVAAILICYACILALDYTKNNNWLYNTHFFLSAIVFGYYFSSELIKNSRKTFVRSLFGISAVIFLYTDFFLANTYFNSLSTAFFFLCILISCLIYFHQLLNNMSEENILYNFNLWLASGYTLYSLGAFFIILSYDYFTDKLPEQNRDILGNLWSVQNILLFISSLIALTSHLWIAYRNKSR